MGLFDSVYVRCGCGQDVEFQSKAGDCGCDVYAPDSVPLSIARDLNGRHAVCADCGWHHILRIPPMSDDKITMQVESFQ